MSKEQPLETFTHKGYTVNIYPDFDAESPRDQDGNLAVMVCFSRRHNVGDKHEFGSPKEFRDWAKDQRGIIIVPIGMIDHSGISVYAGGGPAVGDSAGWDSGTVGYAYIFAEEVFADTSPLGALHAMESWGPNAGPLRGKPRKLITWGAHGKHTIYGSAAKKWLASVEKAWKAKRVTPRIKAAMRHFIYQEIAAYNNWLQGGYCGFTIEKDGEQIDSCWGFDSSEYCAEEARASADYYHKAAEKQAAEDVNDRLNIAELAV